MSFFGGQKQDAGPDPVVAAKTEMEVYTGERERQEDDLMMDPPAWSSKKTKQQVLVVTPFSTPYLLLIPTDLFNKIAGSCFSKCASVRHKDPDLSLGEMTCADRCVSKYMEAQERVGVVLQRANEAQMQQQQSMAQMQQQFGG